MTLTVEQVALRRSGIGGSEIAAICGVHPYKTSLEVYLDKIGIPRVEDESEAMSIGNYLEPALIDAYAQKTGAAAMTRPGTIVHPTEPWMLATPDAIAESEQRIGLECKVRNFRDAPRWGEPHTDQVPDEVALQAHWGMMVTGLRLWDVIVLLAGSQLRLYTLRFDEVIADRLTTLGRNFWADHVLTQTPPRFDGSKHSVEFVKRLHPRHDDILVSVPRDDELDALAHDLARVKEANKRGEGEQVVLECRIKDAIGPNAGLIGPDWRATWKAPKPSRKTDWEGLARSLLPDLPLAQETLITEYTTEKENSRRFLFNPPGGE